MTNRELMINLLTDPKYYHDMMAYGSMVYYDRRGLFTDIWVFVHTDEKYPYYLKVGQRLGTKIVEFRRSGGL